MKDLLELRNKAKARKPKFVRTDANLKKLKDKWRKPRGLHNKRKKKMKGHQKNVSIGYGAPKKVRGLNHDGKKEIIVYNKKDLRKIKEEVALIAGSVGSKKRIEILKECLEKKIGVSNVNDIEKYIKEKLDAVETRKKRVIERRKKKESAKKTVKKIESKEKDQTEVKKEVMSSKIKEPKELTKQSVDKGVDTSRAKMTVPGDRRQ